MKWFRNFKQTLFLEEISSKKVMFSKVKRINFFIKKNISNNVVKNKGMYDKNIYCKIKTYTVRKSC